MAEYSEIDADRDEKRLTDAERRVTMVRLRNGGGSLTAIAAQMGCTPYEVREELRTALREASGTAVQELVGNQQLILGDILRAFYLKMARGDEKAASVILRVLDHQARLFGLYAPSRVEVGVTEEQFTRTASALLHEIEAATARSSGGVIEIDAATPNEKGAT